MQGHHTVIGTGIAEDWNKYLAWELGYTDSICKNLSED